MGKPFKKPYSHFRVQIIFFYFLIIPQNYLFKCYTNTMYTESRERSAENQPLSLQFFQESTTSYDSSRRNEDVVYCGGDFAVVLDGAGGSLNRAGKPGGGYEASRAGLQSLVNSVSLIHSTDVNQVADMLRQAMLDACREIGNVTSGYTTAVLAKIVNTGDKTVAVIANVGDSRAYLYHGGLLHYVTEDDGNVPKGRWDITQRLDSVATEKDYHALSDDERWLFDNRNVIKSALGGQFNPEVGIKFVELLDGDQVGLFSDGITDNLLFEELHRIWRENPPQNVIHRIIELAMNRARGIDTRAYKRMKHDDMSGALILAKAPMPQRHHRPKSHQRHNQQDYSASGYQGPAPEPARGYTGEQVARHHLAAGEYLEFKFNPKRGPIKLEVGGMDIMVGTPGDLGFNFGNQNQLVVYNPEQVAKSGGDGFMFLGGKDDYMLGQGQLPGAFNISHRFQLPDGVLVEIKRDGNKIKVRDLGSSTGTTVQVKI